MQGKTNIMIEIMRKYGVNYYRWVRDTPNKQNKTGVKGVYFDKRHKSYRADIMVKGKKYYLGYCQLPRPTANALEVGACKSSN